MLVSPGPFRSASGLPQRLDEHFSPVGFSNYLSDPISHIRIYRNNLISPLPIDYPFHQQLFIDILGINVMRSWKNWAQFHIYIINTRDMWKSVWRYPNYSVVPISPIRAFKKIALCLKWKIKFHFIIFIFQFSKLSEKFLLN